MDGGVNEYHFWSPVLGQNAVRISGFDEYGGEFFVIITEDNGARYRQRKRMAAEAIEMAISMGLQPGEVRYQ